MLKYASPLSHSPFLDTYYFVAGLKIPKLAAGNYVIIPCTFDAEVLGPFRVAVYASDRQASLSLLETEWKQAKELRVCLFLFLSLSLPLLLPHCCLLQ